MPDSKWSSSEKKVARRAFEAALDAELAQALAEFKAQVAALTDPRDMWDMEPYLRQKRREIDSKYDYRYSRLSWVLAWLLREGRIQEEQLAGLAEEKLVDIRDMASLWLRKSD